MGNCPTHEYKFVEAEKMYKMGKKLSEAISNMNSTNTTVPILAKAKNED